MRTHRLATLLVLVCLVCFAGLATAQDQIVRLPTGELPGILAFGTCSADCPDGSTVTCKGSGCSAKDGDGCSYKTDDGSYKHKDCDLPALADWATTGPAALDRPATVSWLALPHDARQRVEAEHQAIADMAFAMTGQARLFDPTATDIQIPVSFAKCTADCGGGKTVTCTASGNDSCFALDSVACETYHDGGTSTFKSCRDVMSDSDADSAN